MKLPQQSTTRLASLRSLGRMTGVLVLLLLFHALFAAQPVAAQDYDHLIVTLDGREVTVGQTQSTLDGKPAELPAVLNAIGPGPVMTATVEVLNNGEILPLPAVRATITGNKVVLTNLTPTLAVYGRLSIWITGARWQICMIIDWGSVNNPVISVDNRAVTTGDVVAQIDGNIVELKDVVALIGPAPVLTPTVELDNGDGTTTPLPDVATEVSGNRIKLTNLSPLLAERGTISIWISGSRWRICVIITWGSETNPVVNVDGRDVTVGDVTAEIDGQLAEYRRVLALAGSAVVTPGLEIATTTGITLPNTGVTAGVVGNRITFTNLAPLLAQYGKLSIWISSGRWRVCIIIEWGSQTNPVVTVDGRDVTVAEVVAEVDGQPAEYLRVLALPVCNPCGVEISANGTILPTGDVTATVQGNRIRLANLSPLLAQHGRLSIWISGNGWRVCIIIEWGSLANPVVIVDGRDVTVDEIVAEVAGLPAEYRRVQNMPVCNPCGVEISVNNTILPTGDVTATLQGNRIVLTHLDPLLALHGKLSIWISGNGWRVCIIISWDSVTNPVVNVDGRIVEVLDEVVAEVDGLRTEYRRVLNLPVCNPCTVEISAGDIILAAPGVSGTVTGNQISFTNLAPLLATHGKLSIWIGNRSWRICIIIDWKSSAKPDVTVDGREVMVKGVAAELDGKLIDYRRALAILGSEPMTATLIEAAITGGGGITAADDWDTQMDDNRIAFTNLADELAAYKQISPWITIGRVRICVDLGLGSERMPAVLVDGKPVIAYGAAAERGGKPADPLQFLATLPPGPVPADKIEIVANGAAVDAGGVQGVIDSNTITLTGLTATLTTHHKVSIWISYGDWRFCITINNGHLSFMDTIITVDLPGLQAHAGVLVSQRFLITPSHPLPTNTRPINTFALTAKNDNGQAIHQFDAFLDLCVKFPVSDQGEPPLINLRLLFLDETNNQWMLLPSQSFNDSGAVCGKTDHFSEFALVADALPPVPPSLRTLFLPLVNR